MASRQISAIGALESTQRRVFVAAGASLFLCPRHPVASPSCAPSEPDPTLTPVSNGRVLRVSAVDPLLSLSATARAARDGDTIEVEPGDYLGDVAVWPQSDLTVRGVGERPRLIANGNSAEGKAIFVIKGNRVRVENLEFRGARVRARNGAGIRLEGSSLTLSRCVFADNENGILAGNNPAVDVAIDSSAFFDNGNEEGSAHNLYIGTVARLWVEGCWFGPTRVGHLLKSRARVNTVQYCRLAGEGGTGSYELEVANGGKAVLIGNLIQQGPRSENQVMVSYGAEGYRWPENSLTMAFNTVVNDRPRGGVRVRVAPGADRAVLVNNVWFGSASLSIDAPQEAYGNREATRRDFADPANLDYRLRAASPLVGQAGFRGRNGDDFPLPLREYVHEASSCPIDGLTTLTPLSPGAFQRLAR